MELNCEMLGLTKEQMMDRVIDSMAEKVMEGTLRTTDEDGETEWTKSFNTQLNKLVQKTADERLQCLKEENILPKLEELIFEVILQKTNKWGEEKGDPVTFTEYLTEQAESYMQEMVDGYGKTQKESGSSSSYWTGRTTRLLYLIDKSMTNHFQKVSQELSKHAREALAETLSETMKSYLTEAAGKMKLKLVR